QAARFRKARAVSLCAGPASVAGLCDTGPLAPFRTQKILDIQSKPTSARHVGTGPSCILRMRAKAASKVFRPMTGGRDYRLVTNAAVEHTRRILNLARVQRIDQMRPNAIVAVFADYSADHFAKYRNNDRVECRLSPLRFIRG